MKQLLLLLVLAAGIQAATWHVRPDGGTRQQCTGKTDAPYDGAGLNEDCAMKSPYYLFTQDLPQTAAGWNVDTPKWIIAGSDTVILHEGEYRMGYKTNDAAGFWNYTGCRGVPSGCFWPTIPAGTIEAPTRIIGASVGCVEKTKLTGGMGLNAVLNFKGAKNVVAECLEISDFAQCGTGALPLPDQCVRSGPNAGFPRSDYANRGFMTDFDTDNVLLRDINIHGMAQQGGRGFIGGKITAERLRIAGTQGGGWDTDDGSGNTHSTGHLILKNSIIEWNGCLEQYPRVSLFPYYKCFDQSHGGYGDGLGVLIGQGMKIELLDSIFRYNVQDAADLLYVQAGTTGHSIRVERSQAYGNGGQSWKFGAVDTLDFFNNLTINNCRRLSEGMTGLPDTYSAGFTDFCRAGDGIAVVFSNKTVANWFHNTQVGYNGVLYDLICRDAAAPGCPALRFNYKNNVDIAYPRKDNGKIPTLFYECCSPPPDKPHPSGYSLISKAAMFAGTSRQNNFACGHRTDVDAGLPSEVFRTICPKTWLVDEPTFVKESDFDNLALRTNVNGPLPNRGVITTLLSDFLGVLRPKGPAPDVGAYETESLVVNDTGGPVTPPSPPAEEVTIDKFLFTFTCKKATTDCQITVKKP